MDSLDADKSLIGLGLLQLFVSILVLVIDKRGISHPHFVLRVKPFNFPRVESFFNFAHSVFYLVYLAVKLESVLF